MRGATGGCDRRLQRTFRAACQAIVSRLAIDQVFTYGRQRMFICHLRSDARNFFIDGKQQTKLADAGGAEFFSGGNLRSNDSFRVARATSVNKIVVFAGRDKRRHRVHVR